jgi:CubicO group peptidase (beta-lactamase class C family)
LHVPSGLVEMWSDRSWTKSFLESRGPARERLSVSSHPTGLEVCDFIGQNYILSALTTYMPSVDRTFAFDRWDSLVVSKDKIWNYGLPYPTWLYGTAGLNINAPDIAKFDAALLSGRLLAKKSLDQMWTVFRLTSGEPSWFTAGWMYRTSFSPKSVPAPA